MLNNLLAVFLLFIFPALNLWISLRPKKDKPPRALLRRYWSMCWQSLALLAVLWVGSAQAGYTPHDLGFDIPLSRAGAWGMGLAVLLLIGLLIAGHIIERRKTPEARAKSENEMLVTRNQQGLLRVGTGLSRSQLDFHPGNVLSLATGGVGQKQTTRNIQTRADMMKATAIGCVRCLLPIIILTSLIDRVSAQQRLRNDVSSISYSLIEPVFGYKDEPIGNLNVCVVIKADVGSNRAISFRVKMPDSFQALSVTAPITQLSNGDILFEFANDGWGNVGRGTLKEVSGKMQLDLTEIDSPPEADRNIGRNYGTYFLGKVACR